jgi:hypothetical protein
VAGAGKTQVRLVGRADGGGTNGGLTRRTI